MRAIVRKITAFFAAWWRHHFPQDTSIAWDNGDEEFRETLEEEHR
jgi:hypothetical protein